MAAGKEGLEILEPIFGEANSADEASSDRSLLLYVHALDPSRFEIIASDFHSLTFATILTVHQLDDLRDEIGIGGTWSEFVDYLRASLSSEMVKLTLDGEANTKLIAHKSKGLPHISLPLSKLMNSSANYAMANFSLSLFKAFEEKQNDSKKEHEHMLQVKGLLSSEKEKRERLQKELDGLSFVNKRKIHKSNASDKTSLISDSAMDNNATSFSEKQPPISVSETQRPVADSAVNVEVRSVKDTQPTKVGQRAVQVSRRAKTRGVSLKDTDDDDNKCITHMTTTFVVIYQSVSSY